MIYYLIALLILFINILINRSINKRLLYPPTLFSLVWFIVLFFHWIAAEVSYLGIQYISVESIIIFTLGPCVFTIGGLIGLRIVKKNILHSNNSLYVNKKFINIIMLLTTAFLPLYAYESYQIVVANSITGDVMRDLRLNLNSGEVDRKYIYGIIFSYFYYFVSLYLYLVNFKNFKKFNLIYSIILLLMYIILSTGRTFFLQFFILTLGTISILKELKIKYILYSLVSFIAIFFVYGFVLQKGVDKDASFDENISSMTDNFSIYFLGGISAFDYKMINGFENFSGERTFRFPIAILNKLEIIDVEPQKLVEAYVNVPFETNVYTFYQAYIEDFGVNYVVISIFFISLFTSNIFRKSLIDNKYKLQNTYLYGLFLYPIIMSFFQDQFISLFATWFYAFLLVLISKKFIYYKAM